MDENSKWVLTLKNVSNLLQQVDMKKMHVEVLANSEAVKGYVSSHDAFEMAMRQLNAEGVAFVACNNALKAMEIDPIQLLPFVKMYPPVF